MQSISRFTFAYAAHSSKFTVDVKITNCSDVYRIMHDGSVVSFIFDNQFIFGQIFLCTQMSIYR